MNRILTKTLSIVTSLCFLVALLVTLIDVICFNRSFFSYEYAKNGQAEVIGMSDEDLMASTDALLNYLQGKRDTIDLEATINGVQTQVFTTRESLHMEDVKDLYDGAMTVRNVCALVTVIGGVLLFFKEKKNRYSTYLDGLENGLFMMGTFVFCIGAWALLDFSDFWMDFHYLFFDNDLFLLDASSSVMINMFPESFFFDLVFLMIIVFVLCCVGIYIVLRRLHRKENMQ